MFDKGRAEVLVVGAGPVGLFAAASLVERGIDVAIVDAEWRGTGMSYALGLHPDAMALLETIGLAEPLRSAGYEVRRLAFYDRQERVAEVDYAAVDGPFPFLTILPQSALESALEAWLKKRGVEVRWRHRLADLSEVTRPVAAELHRWDEETVGYPIAHHERIVEKVIPFQADFIVGADGHASFVRRRLKIDFPKLRPPSLFAVFEFEADGDLDHEARVVLDERGISVLWPLPGGRARWSFQIEDSPEIRADRIKSRLSQLGRWVFPALDQDRLDRLIDERAPWYTGRVREVVWSVAIRFEERLAAGFGREAAWLAGDAAHLAGPVGLRSMNVGLREAGDLAARLAKILRGSGGPELLSEYDAERKREWRRLFGLEGGWRSGDGAPAFVRRDPLLALSLLPASGRSLDALAAQLDLHPEAPAPRAG
ncbi:MAG: FAD-dependent monooxygenase [Acidobacteria bacterium]|nr:MAG: FAD-dependent monooxygenase [Acidobacteriota bacterium]